MTGPVRVQLRRVKGWRKPEGAVVVSRPTRWGNPFVVRRVDNDSDSWAVAIDGIDVLFAPTKRQATEGAVDCFRHEREPDDYPTDAEIHAELRGRDLACWCPLDRPCHADVLLEIANAS